MTFLHSILFRTKRLEHCLTCLHYSDFAEFRSTLLCKAKEAVRKRSPLSECDLHGWLSTTLLLHQWLEGTCHICTHAHQQSLSSLSPPNSRILALLWLPSKLVSIAAYQCRQKGTFYKFYAFSHIALLNFTEDNKEFKMFAVFIIFLPVLHIKRNSHSTQVTIHCTERSRIKTAFTMLQTVEQALVLAWPALFETLLHEQL